MFPSSTIHSSINSGIANTKTLRYLLLCQDVLFCQSTDLQNFLFGQFGIANLFTFYLSAFSHHISIVVGTVSQKKMTGIYTRSNIARMQNAFVFWNKSIFEFIRKAMGKSLFVFAERQFSIPHIWIKTSYPQQTALLSENRINVAGKELSKGFRFFTTHIRTIFSRPSSVLARQNKIQSITSHTNMQLTGGGFAAFIRTNTGAIFSSSFKNVDCYRKWFLTILAKTIYLLLPRRSAAKYRAIFSFSVVGLARFNPKRLLTDRTNNLDHTSPLTSSGWCSGNSGEETRGFGCTSLAALQVYTKDAAFSRNSAL